MVARKKSVGLRRMRLEKLITKLAQTEEESALTLDAYPQRVRVGRQTLIIDIAKQARWHLEEDTEAQHLHSIDSERRTANC
jgi:hypothetical protein